MKTKEELSDLIYEYLGTNGLTEFLRSKGVVVDDTEDLYYSEEEDIYRACDLLAGVYYNRQAGVPKESEE